MMMGDSIIIVNFNAEKLTKDCLDSVFTKTSGVTFEVIQLCFYLFHSYISSLGLQLTYPQNLVLEMRNMM